MAIIETDTHLAFFVDKQTLSDLSIFGTLPSDKSILAIFDKTATIGGSLKLRYIFNNPLSTAEQISSRYEVIDLFQQLGQVEMLTKNEADFAEYYLNQDALPVLSSVPDVYKNIIKGVFQSSRDLYTIKKGIDCLSKAFAVCYRVITGLAGLQADSPHLKRYQAISDALFPLKIRQRLLQLGNGVTIKASDIACFDSIFRKSNKKQTRELLELLYEIDCYGTIAKVSLASKFCFPEISRSANTQINITGLFHPLIKSSVTNDVFLEEKENLLFLTGGNMAGKSTFLKAMGVCVYLTHLGLPVPAQSMRTSVLKGLYTSINLTDSVQNGYSHFYSEVMRVKEVALSLQSNKPLLVLFDELFRGTNAADAGDATSTVANLLSEHDKSLFIISSHITDITQNLKENSKIRFGKFATIVDGNKPVYNYKLTDGIAFERLGMLILQNENVFDILKIA